MAYISDDHKLVYFAAPGTGSSAVIKAFKDRGIGQVWPEKDIIENGRRAAAWKHTTLDEMRATGIDDRIEGYCRAVGIRNLFAWHVAIFLRNQTLRQRAIRNKKSYVWTELTELERNRYIARIRQQKGMTFKEYLQYQLGRHQSINPQEKYHKEMDFYIHQEAMDEDFARLAERVGLPSDMSVPVYNVTKAMEDDKTYRDYYDDELIDYVYERNAPFFERFPEYSFEGYDPAKRR